MDARNVEVTAVSGESLEMSQTHGRYWSKWHVDNVKPLDVHEIVFCC